MVDKILEQAIQMVMTQTGCTSETEALSYLEARALTLYETVDQAALDVVDGSFVFPHL